MRKPELLRAINCKFLTTNPTNSYLRYEHEQKKRQDVRFCDVRVVRGQLLKSCLASSRLCVSFFLIMLFISCVTTPKTSIPIDDPLNELSLLPAGAKLYFWADAVNGRPLLDVLSFEGTSGKDAEQILDNTSSAVAAIFPSAISQDRRFFIAALGNYPSFSANFSFTFSRSWKKQKSSSGANYWYSKANDLALSLGSKLALVSNIDPLSHFSPEISPHGFKDFQIEYQNEMVLCGWMNNPQESINNFITSMEIPIQIPAEDFYFGINKTIEAAEPWELVFRIKTASAIHARSLVSLFSIARLFISRGMVTQEEIQEEIIEKEMYLSPQEAAVLLFANVPELNGEYLTIRTDSLNEGRIALLFNLFSLHSN